MKNIPIMPNEYKGEYNKNGGFTSTTPRKWTKKELEWVKELIDKGFTNKEIALSIERSEVSVSIKVKRMQKSNYTYNDNHKEEKDFINNNFLNYINPKTLLDLYSGGKQYNNIKTTTNDINKKIKADYNEDAFKLICKLYYEGKKYDVIDLDPFGSAYDCFDIAIKMAKKGLMITLGELGHKRWRRYDYVSSHYDINNIEDFTIQNLINYIQKIGRRNKKQLIIYQAKEWQNIGRVWFEIKPLRITSQWENKNNQLNIYDLEKDN